ncbi:MAG TPA: hypothetical protein VFQ54_03370 [Thermomicrobiales bacterium]|nr:hypothetical protein [Thermomicrobiales bacterium]
MNRRASAVAQRTAAPSQRRKQRGPHILSTLLFIAAIGFAVAAGYLYLQDRDHTENRVPPTALPGRNDLGAVLQQFKDAGLSAGYGRITGHAEGIDEPGQSLTVDGQTVLVFIYNDADKASSVKDRKAAAATLPDDLDGVAITSPSGTDLRKGQPIYMAQGSNIITIMIGGDADLASKVQTVVEALP